MHLSFPEVQVFQDIEHLSQSAARFFFDAAHTAVAETASFSVVLSGGSTPLALYRILSQEPYLSSIPWQQIHFFWGDERCVPPTDPESNYFSASQHLFRSIPLPPENIHRIKGELPPDLAAHDYACRLAHFASLSRSELPYPVFDLVFLGLGQDGHIASIFPGSPAGSQPVIDVTAVYQGRPANRVSLTPLVFSQARRVLFLVSGSEKSTALVNALFGPADPLNCPVHRIKQQPGAVLWLVDQPAASALSR